MIGILGAVACEHNKAFGPPPCTKPNLGGRSEMNIAIPLALVASAALRRLVCRFRDLHRRGSRKVGQGDSSRKHQAGVKQANTHVATNVLRTVNGACRRAWFGLPLRRPRPDAESADGSRFLCCVVDQGLE